jgi:drug/metabolite transporter (DMT)-like permease
MTVLYLIIIIACISGQNITKKMYTKKANVRGTYLFSACTALFSMLFFVVTLKDFRWDAGIIPYAIAFAVSFAVAGLFGVLAIGAGPLSISSLMISYSLMIPTFYGILFLKEPIGIFFLMGLCLLAISLFLVNKKNDKSPVTFKWIVFVFLSFVGNGFCSTFQKMQQARFSGAYKNEFMILSLAIVSVVLFIAALIVGKGDIKENLRHARVLAPVSGVMNGLTNMLVMLLSGLMAVSVMFPLISAGGIIVTYIVSKFFYKEALTKTQFIGFLIGIASIVFLNI